MKSDNIKQELDALPDLGCEEEDIICSIRDEAEFSRSWINDCILRRHIKKTGEVRLSADTRKLIKAKSYDDYIALSKSLQRNLKKQAKALISEIQKK